MKVLSGTFDQSDKIRFPKYYGTQCTAMAVTAACTASLHNPALWTSDTIDECLITGDILHKQSYEHLSKERKTTSNYLETLEVKREVKLTIETTVQFQVEEIEIHGSSTKNESTTNVDGLLNYSIQDALIQIFHQYKFATFTCALETICTMKIDEKYFIFDSHKKGKNGLKNGRSGTAVLMTFESVSELASHITRQISCVSCCQNKTVQCAVCPFTFTIISINLPTKNITTGCENDNTSCEQPSTSKCFIQNARNAKIRRIQNKKELSEKLKNNAQLARQEKLKLNKTPVKKLETLNNSKSNKSENNKQENKCRKQVADAKKKKKKYKNDIIKRKEKIQKVQKRQEEKYHKDIQFRNSTKEKANEKYKKDDQYRNNKKAKIIEKYKINDQYRNCKIQNSKKQRTIQEAKLSKSNTDKLDSDENKSNPSTKKELCQKFEDQKYQMPNIVCTCCAQLFFRKSTVTEKQMNLKFDKIIIDNLTVKDICNYRPHLKTNETGHLCTTCYNNLKKGKIPKFAAYNGLVFDPLPEELRELNTMEERLISARIPFMQIRELGYQKQLGLKGNCINVPININKTVTCLPRMDSEDHTIAIQLMRRMKDKQAYAFENVRPERVFKAARYLINTKLYKDHNITLNETWLQQFEEQHNMQIQSDAINNEDIDELEPHEEIDDTEVMQQQETLLTAGFLPDSGIKMSPGEGAIPLSLLLDTDNDVLSFPTVYGGQQRTFKVKYNPTDIAKAEARHHDRRVATNIPKVMMNHCKARVHKLRSRISINLRKKVKTDSVTVSQILNEKNLTSIIEQNDGYKIVATDRSSPAFWQGKQKKVMAMHRQFGSSSIFMTFSAAETRWNPLIVSLYKILYDKIITEEEAKNLSSTEKMNLIKKDPITVARYIVNRFDGFRSLYHHKNGPFYPYEVDNDFFRIELQFRGSLHFHCIVWIKDCPVFDPHDSQSYGECEKFIDKYITCKKDDTLGDLMNLQYHKCTRTCKKNVKSNTPCRFNYPLPPMKSTRILIPLGEDMNKEDKLRAKHLLNHIKLQTETIAKNNEDCSFNEYLNELDIDEETYITALRSNLKRPTVFLKRNLNERRINAYNREMLILWEAHMDIQFIVSPYGCVKYVVSYVSKSQRGMSKLLKEVADKVNKGDETTCKKLNKILNAFLNNCEISAQEIALHVLNIPMTKSSIGNIYINTCPPEQRVFLKKGTKELKEICENDPNSTDIQEKGLIEHYIHRPDVLESLCLADFAALFTYHKKNPSYKQTNNEEDDSDLDLNDDDTPNKENTDINEKKRVIYTLKDNSGFITGRKKRLVIQYRKYNEGDDTPNFHRENLMLFTSWRDEPMLSNPNLDKIFHESLEEIRANKNNYCKHDDTFDKITLEEFEDLPDDDEDKPAPDYRIFELNDSPSDFGIEIPGTSNAVNKLECCRFPLPNILPDNEYVSLITSLNEKQRKYLLNLTNLIKTKPKDQFFHFLSGGAGVGKSTLIHAMKQVLERYWIKQINNSPDNIHILTVAPTGKAATGVHGMTIDSAFGFPFNVKERLNIGRILNSDTRNTLASKFISLKLIILEEVSMCSFTKFQAINYVLQEIFENNKPFGGISIICVGDFNQLPPVVGTEVFKPSNDDMSRLLGTQLWHMFTLYELTEIMRQKDDLKFANALNNLALGRTTDEEDEMFRSRQLDNLNLEPADIMHNIVTLYYRNFDVDSFNTLYIARQSGEKFLSKGYDVCTGPGSNSSKQYMLQQALILHHKKTQNLHKNLQLCINTKYIVSQNIAVPDGVANGSSCILKKVIMGRLGTNEIVPLRAYVEFDDKTFGEKTREKLKQLIKKDNITNPNFTPIERVKKSFSITESSPLKVTRDQLPLLPSNAQTVHCSQSCTYEAIMVYPIKLFRKLLYTAFSRVKSLAGLFIAGTYIKPQRATVENDGALKEMTRMREDCLLKFQLTFPEDIKTENNLICIFHNVHSLNAHFEEVFNNTSFLASDIIIFAETYALTSDLYELPNLTCIFRNDCSSHTRKAFGTIIFIKNILLPYCCIIYKSILVTDGYHSTVVSFTISEEVIIMVHKSPKTPWKILKTQITEAISISNKYSPNNITIIGDFNIKYQNSDVNYKSLIDFMKTNELHMILDKSKVTTDLNTMIDLCFSTNEELKGDVFESLTSDHKPIWFEIPSITLRPN